jgi:hypothetical protein
LGDAAKQELPEAPAETPKRTWRHRRVLLRLLAAVVAIVAALLVTVLSVDLGPWLRETAEIEGSNYMERPLRIGRLSAKLTPGEFLLEDVVIAGRAAADRPFFKAKTITVKVPWWSVITRELIVESVVLTDWEMTIETWPGGRHNFPKVTPKSTSKREGPPRFITTVKSVLATRGHLVFQDHGTPWGIDAPNLTVQLVKSGPTNDYRGRASFSSGTVRIMSYVPFGLDMRSRFKLNGGNVEFERIDLDSDGARSVATGVADLARWPEQLYQVQSHIDFPTQKNIYFHGQKFEVSGVGDFTGTFHLFKGGRELKGSFTTPMAGVNDWRFPHLRGLVRWVPDRLEITNATSGLYGGAARFDYVMTPLGKASTPARARWDVEYRDVDLAQLTDFLETQGLRLAGRASGKNHLEWPLGKWALKTGRGEATVTPPTDMRPMTRELPADLVSELTSLPEQAGPFNPRVALGYQPLAGRIVYAIDPEWIRLERSWAATERTYVEFEGQTAFGERSRIPFHVTSLDWQESDRLLAGIMTAFGSPTGAVPVGGYGEFDGVLLDAFKRPRIQGKMRSERMRAWDVVWGSGRADLAIENSYVFVSNARMASGEGEIRADGQFSLGYPRRDGGDEIDATIRVTRWPLAELRHAFNLDEYPAEGTVSGEYQLYGKYQTPLGFGRLTIHSGTAYGEPFDSAIAALRFEGNGVRLDGIDIKKSTGGVTGAAWVGWDGTYSFNADGAKIPVESLVSVAFPKAPLSGRLQFNATGAGTFNEPRYDVKLGVDDLFAGDEGIGQLSGRLALRGELMTLDLEAASPRLVVSGSGRIALTPELDAELTVRFRETSLDPYVRFFEPRLSPFTTAIVGGTLRAVGELSNLNQLVIDTKIEQLDLKLFDYRVRNQGPIELTLDRNALQIGNFHLVGDGTQLQLDGKMNLREKTIGIQATGDANLGILQGFFRNLRSRGTAALKASITGQLNSPVFSGSATIADGRLRQFSLPHSLESINGKLSFDASGIRVEDVQGRLGGGNVTFGGRIGLNGFALGDLSLTAIGERMSVRYPEGFRSIIDADLSLQGTLSSLVLNGSVIVRDAVWSRRIDTSPDLFNLAGTPSTPLVTGAPAATLPVRFDIGIVSASSLRIQNNIANMVASADLRLQGTYDRPVLFGRAEIERGNVVFEGNRYVVTPGGSIDFFNPSRIEPFFDIEAETRIRRPQADYRLTIGLSGTTNRFTYSLNADPPLPEVDIISLLFGQDVDLEDAELRQLRSNAAQKSEEALLQESMVRLLASPISAPVGRALGEAFGIDTVQITPTLGNESDSLTPSARILIGKRISTRAYLTFARALGSSSSARDQILVLEYDQNDRVGWVLTQLGDGTFALDFRVRHRF